MSFLSSLSNLSNLGAEVKPCHLHIVADMEYSVNHQRGGFQRVNFMLIPSPLGVKALIFPEEATLEVRPVRLE